MCLEKTRSNLYVFFCMWVFSLDLVVVKCGITSGFFEIQPLKWPLWKSCNKLLIKYLKSPCAT